MSDRLRVGVVGAGFMGGVHLAAWAAEGNPTVVFSLDPTQAATLAARHGAALARSLDELLGSVDVVDVCTETDRHAEVAIAAARAGRHVICEKPLARTLADAEAIVDACAEARVRLFVAHVVRFFPEYALAREQVVAGEVGLPAVLRLRRASFRPTHPPDHWFFDHARSGGMIVDLMIHDFDYARWVAGEVVAVQCRSVGVERPGLAIDHAIAILTHDSGAISHVTGSWAYPPPTFRTSLEIAGSHGLIEFDSAAAPPIVSYLRPQTGDAARPVGLPGSPLAEDPYRLELRGFARSIVDGTPARVSAEDGLAALVIALAADASARTGTVVRLDAATEARA